MIFAKIKKNNFFLFFIFSLQQKLNQNFFGDILEKKIFLPKLKKKEFFYFGYFCSFAKIKTEFILDILEKKKKIFAKIF